LSNPPVQHQKVEKLILDSVRLVKSVRSWLKLNPCTTSKFHEHWSTTFSV